MDINKNIDEYIKALIIVRENLSNPEWTSTNFPFICNSVKDILSPFSSIENYLNYSQFMKWFRFYKPIAIENFNGRDEHAWWKDNIINDRVRFLNYIICGHISRELPDVINQTARKWLGKELVKSKVATKYIGRGALRSSTNTYEILYSKYNLANLSEYNSNDIVWVSCNGNRRNRSPVTVNGELRGVYTLLEDVIKAKATIIADTADHLIKTKRYNIGEMELVNYLLNNGYKRVELTGTWQPK